jgi:hypothetical protein
MWRRKVTLALLAISLLVVALLAGIRLMAAPIANQMLVSFGLRLDYDQLEIDLRKGLIQVRKLSISDRPTGEPLLSIEAASLTIFYRGLVTGDNSAAELVGRDIDVYVHLDQDSQTDSEWEAGAWLGYRDFLPGHISVDNLNLHWLKDDPEAVSQLVKLRAQPAPGNGQMRLTLDALHGEADLQLAGTLSALKKTGAGRSGVAVEANLVSQYYSAQAFAKGSVNGAGDVLSYQFQTELEAVDISATLTRFDIDIDLAGKFGLKGKLEGDLESLALEMEAASLSNLPEYQFAANGQFNYQFTGASRVDIEAQGELAQLVQLVDWFEIDVAELGSAKASVRLAGSLDELLLKNITLHTDNDQNIQIKVAGDLRLNNFSDITLMDNRGPDISVAAPSLAALSHWTGELDFETGPWQLSGQVGERQGKPGFHNVKFASQNADGVRLSAEGAVNDVSSLFDGDVSGIAGIEFKLGINSDSSRSLSEPFLPDQPEFGAVQASAIAHGTLQKLWVDHILVATGYPGTQLELSNGSVQLTLVDDLGFSDLVLPLTAKLDSSTKLSPDISRVLGDLRHLDAIATIHQVHERFGVRDISVELKESEATVVGITGSIRQLSPLDGLQFQTHMEGLSSEDIVEFMQGELDYAPEMGRLHGQFNFASKGGHYRIKELSLRNEGAEQFQFLLEGEVEGSLKEVDMNLQLKYAVDDTRLLQEISGVHLAALSGEVIISGSEQLINLVGSTRFGETELDSRLLVTLGDDGISDVKGSITTERLRLPDIGLDYALKPKPAEQKSTTASPLNEPLPLDSLPDLPIDLILAAAVIDGGYLPAEHFTVHLLTGSGLYELQELVVKYTGGYIRANAKLDTRAVEPVWTLNTKLDDFNIERLRNFGAPDDVTGKVNTIVHLKARGLSPEEMISSLDGEVAVAFEDTTLKGAAYDRLAVDTLSWFYTGGILENKTHFNCVMGEFDLNNGVANSKLLYAESAYLVADGTASINLPQQTMDLLINPRSKSRTFQIPGQIGVKGPFNNLYISTDAISDTADIFAQGVLLVPTFAIKMFDHSVSLFDSKDEKSERAKKVERLCPTSSIR